VSLVVYQFETIAGFSGALLVLLVKMRRWALMACGVCVPEAA
jgi:hypothetical protein